MKSAKVVTDATDHMEFHCPECLTKAVITSVVTDMVGNGLCTYIYGKCCNRKCEDSGNEVKRKMYWDNPKSIELAARMAGVAP